MWGKVASVLICYYVLVPRYQAIAIKAFATISTGITSAWFFSSTSIVLMTPFPAPTRRPTGPLRESTQPGRGSYKTGITKKTCLKCVFFGYTGSSRGCSRICVSTFVVTDVTDRWTSDGQWEVFAHIPGYGFRQTFGECVGVGVWL